MKGFLRILAILLLLAAAGAGIFLATFDADRFRPMVVKKMEAAIGRPVKLERLSLAWKGEAAAGLQGLQIPPSFRADRVQVPLSPLLKHQLRLKMEGARLSGVNLLRESFDRLTVLPGLTEALLSQLPPAYAQKLNESDTVFHPMDLILTMEGQQLSFQELRAATDSFELVTGPGQMGFNGSLRFPAQIFIQPDLSAAILRSMKELQILADPAGRISLPVRVEGTLQKPSVLPDLAAIGPKLFSGQAQELIGDLLNKVFEKGKKGS